MAEAGLFNALNSFKNSFLCSSMLSLVSLSSCENFLGDPSLVKAYLLLLETDCLEPILNVKLCLKIIQMTITLKS